MESSDTYPLTRPQQLVWLSQLINPGIPLYHIAFSCLIHGDLDPARFSRAFEETVAKTDSLRTVIRTGPDQEPYAVVLPEIEAGLTYRDVRNDPNVRDHLHTHLDSFIWLPFDLGERLFHAWLFRLGEQEYEWVLTTHHIIWDGISNRLFYDQVEAAYAGRSLPADAPGFRSIATQELSRPDPEAQAYWDARLPDLSRDFAFYGRAPGNQVHPMDRFVQRVDPDRLRAIDRLRAEDSSPDAHRFYFFASIYAAYLSRLTGIPDPVIGMVYHGRRRPEHRETPGFFSRVLPLQVAVHPGDRLPDVLNRVRAEATAARRNLGGIVANSRRDTILHTNVNLRVQQFRPFHGMPVDVDALHSGWNEHCMVLNIHNFSEDRLTIGLDISKTMLENEQREDAAARFNRLVDYYLENPTAGVADGPILTTAERREILVAWQTPQRPLPEIPLAAQFEEFAGTQPDRTAYIWKDRQIDYCSLNRAAGRIADHIRERTAAETVGISLEIGLDVPIAVLAVLKAERGFVMLPPDLPDSRRRSMMADCGVDLVLTHNRWAPLFVGWDGTALPLDDLPGPPGEPVQGSQHHLPLDATVYITYTSGSSGRPKGVRVPQRQLLNMLAGRAESYPASEDEVLCHKTYLGFVDSTVELFEGLLQGVPTVILDEETAQNPQLLVAALAGHGVTRARFVPEHLKAVVEAVPGIGERLPALRLIANTAASIRPADLELFAAAFPDRTFINTFGLSELLSVTAGELRIEDATDGRLPIGRPIPNRLVYVLDRFMEPVPPGVPGDLYLGGDDLALGFVNLPEEDARRFLPNPYEPGGRLFRTGDLARWRPDGRLEHIGRRDQQVKVRGQRVELAEIEANLGLVPGVRQAAAAALEKDGRTVLVAYIVPTAGEPDIGAIRAELAHRLPDYMIPSLFVALETMPLTRSGKIDRQQLPEPDLSRRQNRAGGGPEDMTAAERRLVSIWEDILGVGEIGRDEDFFALGGDSLLAIKIQHRVETAFKVRIPVAAFIQASTVAEQAALVAEAGEAPLFGRRLIALNKNGGRPPLFLVPPAGSTVLAFQGLARHLSPDQPVYGLQPWGTDGEVRPHYSLRRMAADYIRDMRSVWPEGPYLLGGMCFGGIVVFEMARQLERRGEAPRLVVVLDTLVPPNMPVRERFMGLGRLVKRAVLGKQYAPANLMRRLQGQTALGEMAAEEMGDIDRVFQANALARFLYGGVRYRGRLDVLFSSARPGFGRREDWMLTAEEVIVHNIPGAHSVNDSILKEPNVRALAGQLEELIERAIRGDPKGL